MKCLICGRDFKSVANHLRRTHQVSPDDYREEFGILKGVALVDSATSEAISSAIKNRLKDPEYRETMTQICRDNAVTLKTTRAGKSALSRAGAESLSLHRKERNKQYLIGRSEEVAKILLEKKTIEDVRRDIGVNPSAVKAIISMGLATYSKKDSIATGTKRRLASKGLKSKSH